MGNTAPRGSRPAPNVREHHARALYVNVPISRRAAEQLTLAPCEPDEFGGCCWLSVVVDDLDSLEAWLLGRWWPTGMSGWMCKVNLLVRCPDPLGGGASAAGGGARAGKEQQQQASRLAPGMVRGYQITRLYFEAGLKAGGWVKVAGARATQRVPAHQARFVVSSGGSGRAMASPLREGMPYSATVQLNRAGGGGDGGDGKGGGGGGGGSGGGGGGGGGGGVGEVLLDVSGELAAPAASDLAFFRFVTERPHKFLVQQAAAAKDGGGGGGGGCTVAGATTSSLAYSPEHGTPADGTRCGPDGAMLLRCCDVEAGGSASSGSATGGAAAPASSAAAGRLLVGPLLAALGVVAEEGAATAAAAGAAVVCFLQPDYLIVDHKNIALS